MYWILAAICLLALLMVPRLRPAAVAGLVILGALLLWGVIERVRGTDPADLPERGRPSTPAAVTQSFPLEDVVLDTVELTGAGAPFKLSGRVSNASAQMRLKSFMIDITRHDCYEGALDPSGCVVRWQSRQWVEVGVPPQEARDFVTSIWERGDVTRVVGKSRDAFKVIAASGEPHEGSAIVER
jgi:hypothetical protein